MMTCTSRRLNTTTSLVSLSSTQSPSTITLSHSHTSSLFHTKDAEIGQRRQKRDWIIQYRVSTCSTDTPKHHLLLPGTQNSPHRTIRTHIPTTHLPAPGT